MSNAKQANWIAVDWGTSKLRVWAMNENRPIAEVSTDDGMGALKKSEFEPVLTAVVEPIGRRVVEIHGSLHEPLAEAGLCERVRRGPTDRRGRRFVDRARRCPRRGRAASPARS